MLDDLDEAQIKSIFAALAVFSGISLVLSLALLPVFVARMPTGYFASKRPPQTRWKQQHPVLRGSLLVFKNLIGGVLLIGGILMLVLPGQGLLTILAGLILMNYPGKRRLERWLVSRPRILQAANWIRRRAGRPPLRL